MSVSREPFYYGSTVLVGEREGFVDAWQGGCNFDLYDISGVHDPVTIKVVFTDGTSAWISTAEVLLCP